MSSSVSPHLPSMPPPSSSALRNSSSPVSPKAGQEGQTSKKRSIANEIKDIDHDHGVSKSSISNRESISQSDGSDLGPDVRQNENPSKKRKLTSAEKEEKEKEKARKEQERVDKEREKAEKKAASEEKKKALEEAKKKRDQEKQKKDEERAEAQKRKDEEKKKREQEKARKDEEKAKKERAQTRLSAFFAKPKVDSLSSPSKLNPPVTASDKLVENEDRGPIGSANASTPSDYERYFQPFFVKQHVKVAPQHAFIRDTEYKEYIQKKLDEGFGSSGEPAAKENMVAPTRGITANELADMLHVPYCKRVQRGSAPRYTVKQLLELINTSEAETNISSSREAERKSPNYYLGLLNALPRKHLHFAEDVRPPYCGTFTRVPPLDSSLRKGRNPFEKSLPNVDYDYDSEAEWIAHEEEEDGEDLLSELGDEEEDEDGEDEEMEEFLDDEGDGVKRRGGVLCPLLPFSSGLCWENNQGRNSKKEFQEMKLGVLLEGVSGPIDPFSNHYWLGAPRATNNPALATVVTSTLAHRPAQNTSILTNPQPPKKLIPTEDLEAFKKAVDGSDMTKAGLVELLKKQFPKASKDAIRETLGQVAVRRGGKEADKRWELRH